MTIAISVELPESTVRRLEEASRRKNVSQNDLIVQGIESKLAEELDQIACASTILTAKR